MQEIIEGLGIMNYELVDKVKNASSAKRTAIKLYDKSKESASRHFEQSQIENEEKNQLNDELTCVLKAQESQQKVIQENENMVQALKFTKLNLKRECRVGRREGVHWPLWVTEVCCELLINGSPPSAIPSSIGTLFASRLCLHRSTAKSLKQIHR